MKLAVGVNSTLPPLTIAVPPTTLLTPVTVRVWPLSFAGPVLSLPVRVEPRMVRWPLSSATALSASFAALGASLTSVTVNEAVAVAVRGAGAPLVVPLSVTV